MAGHSKWANIKRRKGAQDARRSRLFSRLSRELAVAVQHGGADPSTNPRLRLAIQNARGQNMPNDNIQRAIDRASGADSAALQERTFSCYSADGVGLLVETTSDNNNRTVGQVRSTVSRHGGSLGQDGSLQHLFTQQGCFTLSPIPADPDAVLLELIEAGMTEDRIRDGALEVRCAAESFGTVAQSLDALGLAASQAVLVWVPTVCQLVDATGWSRLERLAEALEALDDVQSVTHNARRR